MVPCPICLKENLCAVDSQPNQCWCFTVKIDKALIALLPDSLLNKSCICLACVTLFKQDPQAFKEILRAMKV